MAKWKCFEGDENIENKKRFGNVWNEKLRLNRCLFTYLIHVQ